jgi:hypothetical protein
VLLELAVGRDTIGVLREIDPSNAGDKLTRTFALVTDTVRNQDCQVSRTPHRM